MPFVVTARIMPPERATNHRAIEIGLVIHGPELIDSGKIADVVDVLRALGPLHAQAGGTMARVAVLDKHLTFIDASQRKHTSDALDSVSDKEVLVLANCGKTLDTGTVFGQIVSSRVRRSVIQVERPGFVDGRIILWRGVDGDKSRHIKYAAKLLSDRLSLKFVERQKVDLSVENTGDIVSRHVSGARRGEPVFVQGTVVGTVVDDDVVVKAEQGRIVDILGVEKKAHGLEKIRDVNLRTAYIKTGYLRSRNKACSESTLRPARPLKRGRVTFVNHGAEGILESVDENTICAITVGDDTTSICGDILSRAGIPIIGITDGDGDGIYAGACTAQGSIVLRLNNASDDEIGSVLERSGALDGGNYTLSNVIEIIAGFLRQVGAEFVRIHGNDEPPEDESSGSKPDI